MMRVETTSDMVELQKKCIEVIRFYVDLGNKKLGINLPYPKVTFDIKGTCGGYAHSGKNWIQLNPTLLRENGQKYIDDTPPHEVAHLLCDLKHGSETDVHGPKWRATMWTLGLKATRCHSFNTKNVPTQVGKHKNPKVLTPINIEGAKVTTPRGGVRILEWD